MELPEKVYTLVQINKKFEIVNIFFSTSLKNIYKAEGSKFLKS